MKSSTRIIAWTGLLALAACTAANAATLYAPTAAEKARAETFKWLSAQGIKDEATVQQTRRLWSETGEASARDVLARVVQTFALADEPTRRFVEKLSLTNPPLTPPEPVPLEREGLSPFYRANLSLYYGRYLAQRRMYDEALAVLSKIDPQEVVDPATCLFYKAVCEHQLLKQSEGLATLKTLQHDTEDVPVSYASVATLMEHELKALKDNSLDAISRKMRDSERRLDLARSGPRVQKVQREIVADLDQLIEKLEAQGGT